MSGAIASINWNPAEKTLRQFGFVTLVGFPLLAWALARWFPSLFVIDPKWAALYGLALGVFAAAVGMISPKMLKPIFVGLSLVTFPIGLVVGELFLGTIFYLLFGLVSVIFRLVGFDPMTQQFDRAASTYWTPKAQPTGPKQYFKQY
jgi:hypothetical protein